MIKYKITFSQKYFCDIGETEVVVELGSEYFPILINKHKKNVHKSNNQERVYNILCVNINSWLNGC